MRAAAIAIGWQFQRRHRWGLIALAIYFAALAALKVTRAPVHFNDAESFAFAVLVPLTATFIYFLAIFTFGLDGDIAGRQSIFPSRLFTLPMSTSGLVGWTMAYGCAAIVVLWFAARLLAMWPSSITMPIVWPALLAASLLAWTQALTWMPYALPGLRVIVTVLWLATIDAIVMIAMQYKPSELLMIAILAPNVPLAFMTARFAVAKARRGEIPNWRLPEVTLRSARTPFHSAAGAQAWFEWRQHGRTLPALVAILLPFELSLMFVFRETPSIVFEMIVAAVTTPLLMAMFVAATVRHVTITTRPLTNASLIAAKLKATLRSAGTAWLLVIIAVPLALVGSGTAQYPLESIRRTIEIIGVPRYVALASLVLAWLVLATWKQLVQSLYIGMSGREWLPKASLFATLALLVAAGPILHWLSHDRAAWTAVWSAIPWLLAALVCMKTFAAAWIAMRLYDARLISARGLILGAVLWTSCAFALYAVLAWIFPDMVFRHYVLALLSPLAIPLVRISFAPLALDWNRHR